MKKQILGMALLLLLVLVFAACRVDGYVAGPVTPTPTPERTTAETPEVDDPTSYASPPTLDVSTLPASPPFMELFPVAEWVTVHYWPDDFWYYYFDGPAPNFVDSAQFESYHHFIDPDFPYAPNVLFVAESTLRDFRFIEVDADLELVALFPGQVLYSLDELTPETPFLTTWMLQSEASIHRGISFVDDEGITRYFAIHASGYGGTLFLIELDERP